MKIRISLTSKLLLLISLLLTSLIGILNFFAVSLFFNDKKAYIYDTQATASMLAGREFTAYLQNSIDTLKVELGSIDVTKPVDAVTRNTLQYLLDNQKSLIGVDIVTLNTQTGGVAGVFKYFPQKTLEDNELKTDEFVLNGEQIAKFVPALLSGFVLYRNISKSGQTPMLTVFFTEKSTSEKTTEKITENTKTRLALAIGYISLKHYFKGAAKSLNRLLIIDPSGALLFHSDLKEMYATVGYATDPIFIESKAASTLSGAKEYKTSDGTKMLGSFYKPGLGLTVLSQVEYSQAMKSTYALTEKFIMFAVGMLGLAILIGLLFSKRITSPLQRLYKATDQIARGDFEMNLPVTSHDEIGVLTNAFTVMSKKIQELIENLLDKMRVDQELEIAKTVQQSLFPENIINNENLSLASHYQSASECGGDWWGYFRHENKHVIAIADATGHGLPSALITAAARSCFSVIEKLATGSNFNLNPGEMLDIANRVIYDSAQGKIMMTFFVAVIDFSEHTVTFASAAHNPPWLFSPAANGSFKMSSLVATGLRLGESRNAPTYETKNINFKAQDTLFFYTDGLLEGKNIEGAQYGKKQSRKILEAVMGGQPEEVLNTIMTDFLAHNEGKALDDDVTLAVARFLQ